MKIKFVQKIIDKIRGKKKKKKKQKHLPYEERFKTHYGYKHVYQGQDSHDLIYEELSKDKPSFICRYGGIELDIVKCLFDQQDKNRIIFGEREKKRICNNAGFFNATDYHLSRFSYEFLELCKNVDILAIWFDSFEEKIATEYSKDAKLILLDDLNPVSLPVQNPYTRILKGKKVLVVHPFEQTIKEQYKKREFLFDDPNILPEFELKTVKAVQSIADNKDLPYKNWFEALDYMKKQISQIDFDIAIIGCGAYGIFLADYVKSIGKKAIHLGGATQLLFGIIGRRWEDVYHTKTNQYWVRPSEADKPKGYQKIEKACYW